MANTLFLRHPVHPTKLPDHIDVGAVEPAYIRTTLYLCEKWQKSSRIHRHLPFYGPVFIFGNRCSFAQRPIMKFILRILGTWFCGLALVLIIVDGAKTLAANVLVMTSLAETWSSLHLASWTQVNHTLMTILPEIAGKNLSIHVMSCPSWAIFGVLGLLLLLAGRAPTQKRYVATY